MPISSTTLFRRDSWPPTQIRLSRSGSAKTDAAVPRPLLEDIDEDPLTYFLTSTPALGDEDMEDDMMDFDAGIEDQSHPKDIVRSVSPSTLTGLSRASASARPTSPDFDSDVPTSDDDEEDYVRYSSSNFELLSLKDLAIDSLRYRPRSPVLGADANALLSPASWPAARGRGRSQARGRPMNSLSRSRSLSARTRPNHLWREPSPDVWSIQEETEEEMLGEMMRSIESTPASPRKEGKSLKKVRFLLPATEM